MNDIVPESFEREQKPLPKKVTEYIQKARDELKKYEDNKMYYEKKRKRGIVIELIELLEECKYPKKWLRLIIARELADYISITYIEKILAEIYPNKIKVKELSTHQLAEITRNDDKIPIEVSSTGESIVDVYGHNAVNDSTINTRQNPAELKTETELQAEGGTSEKVKSLREQNQDLQTRCFKFEELAKEGLLWKERYIQLQQELSNSNSNPNSYEDEVVSGTTEIEFGPEFLPLTIEYNPQTNQFSAWISQEVIERVIAVLRRR